MSLEEQFKKETGFDALKMYQIKEIGFSTNYVEWIEKQHVNLIHSLLEKQLKEFGEKLSWTDTLDIWEEFQSTKFLKTIVRQ
jgi:hypothetical protein